MNTIKINNAYLHNLKNIDISIPKNKLVTATGVSGSGKTTVFFDILFQVKNGRNFKIQRINEE